MSNILGGLFVLILKFYFFYLFIIASLVTNSEKFLMNISTRNLFSIILLHTFIFLSIAREDNFPHLQTAFPEIAYLSEN